MYFSYLKTHGCILNSLQTRNGLTSVVTCKTNNECSCKPKMICCTCSWCRNQMPVINSKPAAVKPPLQELEVDLCDVQSSRFFCFSKWREILNLAQTRTQQKLSAGNLTHSSHIRHLGMRTHNGQATHKHSARPAYCRVEQCIDKTAYPRKYSA